MDRQGLTDWLQTTIKPQTKVQNTGQSAKHGLTDQYSRTNLTKHGLSQTKDYFRDSTMTIHCERNVVATLTVAEKYIFQAVAKIMCTPLPKVFVTHMK